MLWDTVGYLPTIDSLATAMNTIYEVLMKARQTKDELKMKDFVVVFDQAIYAKAVEIMWKHRDLFADIVPRLGVFHTISCLQSDIGKQFSPAGLRDVIIESGVIEEGPVDEILTRKAYNRAMRFHKLMYEACMRLIWRGCMDWFEEENFPEYQELDTLSSNINNLSDNDLDSKSFNEILENDVLNAVHKRFQQYLNKLRGGNGTMSTFWMSYVHLTSLILDFISTSREKGWTLHLISISNLIPWCFAYNRSNYAKYLPWHLLQMINLPMIHADVHEYLADGNFSTQIENTNPFGCIPVDQTIEKTINKNTQTLGGTKGFSTKKVLYQGIILQPITEHLVLDNSDTWQIVREMDFEIQI